MDSYPAGILIVPIPGRYPAQVIGRLALRHPLVMARANMSRDLEGLVATPELVRETLFTDATPDDTVGACHGRLTGASPALFREMVQGRPNTPKPGTPIAVIAPREDASFTPEMQERLAERLSAEYFEVEGTGHDVPLDRAAPSVIRLILSWLGPSEQTSDPQLASADGR
jgi:pimeloyl-ACP methyl ester carboxylesterase